MEAIRSDERQTERAGLEALLFACNEPIHITELARVMGLSEREIEAVLTKMGEDYQSGARGFTLDRVSGGVRLVTKPEHAALVQELLRPVRSGGLSQAALETLAIVAYKQPITRVEVETVRGVRAGSALNTLIERDLIQELGRKEVPGKPILYGTTNRFLVEFGLQSIKDLPPLDEQLPGQVALDFLQGSG